MFDTFSKPETAGMAYRAPPQAMYNRPATSAGHSATRNAAPSVSRRVSGTVARFVGRFTPTVTPTPISFIIDMVKEIGRGGLKGADHYRTLEVFSNGTEAEVSVIQSRSTGKTFVMKHTHPVVRDEDNGKTAEEVQHYKRCNETYILDNILKPFPNVINLHDSSENRFEAGRQKLILEHCTGGNLVQALDWWVTRRSVVPEPFVLHVFVEMAMALASIHHGFRYRGDGKYYQDEFHRPIIHGDLKEDQIFLRWDKIVGGMPEIILGRALRNNHWSRHLDLPRSWIYHAPEDKAIYGDTNYNFENRHIFYKMVNARTVASDVYALGQIMYCMAARDCNLWPIGQDPSAIEISREYSTPGLRDAIRACLAVDPAQRAEMSFKPAVGMLPLIENLRKARDSMIERRGALHRSEFAPKFGPPQPAKP